MARPSPNIVASTPGREYQIVEIAEVQSLWMIHYCGKPFQLRKRSTIVDDRYKHVIPTYANHASTINMANKRNRLFRTSDFTVAAIIP